MNIAYVCGDPGVPIRGDKGASVHVRELVRALATIGHDVRVFAANAAGNNVVDAPVREIPLDRLGTAAAAVLRTVSPSRHPRLSRESFEIGHALSMYRALVKPDGAWRPAAIYERYSLFSYGGVLAARRLGIPHALEVNAILRRERLRSTGVALPRTAAWLESWLTRQTDVVFAVSPPLAQYLKERRRDGVHVLENGVDLTRFSSRNEASNSIARAKFGLDANATIVGFAGSLKPWHGVDILVNAIARLANDVPNVQLVVVGDGPALSSLVAQVASLEIGDRVRFLGAIEHAQMPAILTTFDVAVAPYLPLDDFYFSPLKIYEYMAVGTAVIASDIGEIGAMLDRGAAGVLVPPADTLALAASIGALCIDRERRLSLGERARERVAGRTWVANANYAIDRLRGGTAA